MYLIINGNKYSVSKRKVTKDTIEYLTVSPEPKNISGTISMYRDDGFLMSEDNVGNYERQTYSGTLLTLTNKPKPVEIPVDDDIENTEPTADELMNILLGV